MGRSNRLALHVTWRLMDWDKAYAEGQYSSIVLPLKWNPFAVRRVQDLFHCDRCGECCHYDRVPVTQVDVDRAPEIAPYVIREGDKGYFITKGGCPFYKDGCSIYERRPDVCWLYPLQSPITLKDQERVVIRLRCQAAL
ncbi:MAG: YkgJ family cysteine cluster protein, partial [Dehalococcoidia bacterium]